MAALSLAAFALGLPAFASVKVLAPGFFSRQNTKTPMRFALYAIGFNLLLNICVVLPWIWNKLPAGHAILALSAAVSAYLNATLLYRALRREQAYTPSHGWKQFWLQALTGLVAMAGVLIWLQPELAQWQNWSALQRALRLASLILAGAVTYVVVLFVMGARPTHFKLAEN